MRTIVGGCHFAPAVMEAHADANIYGSEPSLPTGRATARGVGHSVRDVNPAGVRRPYGAAMAPEARSQPAAIRRVG